ANDQVNQPATRLNLKKMVRTTMFESLPHTNFLFSPVDSGASKKMSARLSSPDHTIEELAASNEELRNLNRELSEACRAAYNLLEDAQLTESQLANDLANMRLLTHLAQ